MTQTQFERHALYEEVWQAPITQLAKKYGLSDNGLRKICVALNVPLPPRGYWAKRAAGICVRRPALPAKADRQTFISDPPPPATIFRTSDDAIWLEARLEFDAINENEPAYEPTPTCWHPVIAGHKRRLKNAAKELEIARRANERWEKVPPDRRGFSMDDPGWKWRTVVDRGQALIDSHKPLPFRVSAGCYERALRIANAISVAAKSRGFKVGDSGDAQRLVLAGHNAVVPWRLSEKLDQRMRTRIGYDGKKEPQKYRVPTGVLRLTLEATYASTITFEDRPELPLEKQLLQILAGVYKCVIRQRVKEREDADRKRRWDEEAREHARIEAERRAAAIRLEQERAKRDELIAESKRWQEARILRDYVAYRQGLLKTGVSNPALTGWVSWASSVADDLDPSGRTGRVVSDPDNDAALEGNLEHE